MVRMQVSPSEPDQAEFEEPLGDDPAPVTTPGPGRSFGVRITQRRIRLLHALNIHGLRLLHLADFVAVYITLVAVTAAWTLLRTDFGLLWPDTRYYGSYLIVAVLHVAVFYLGGLYDREPRLGSRPRLPRIVALVGIAASVTGVISWMLAEFLIPRSLLIFVAVFTPLAVALNRRISRWLQYQREGAPRVILVGADKNIAMAQRHLGDIPSRVQVVGESPDVPTAVEMVDTVDATEVLLLDGRMLDDIYPGPLTCLEGKGVTALQIVSPRDSLLGLSHVGEIGGMPFVRLSQHVLPVSQRRLKRLMDLVLLLAVAPVAVPLVALVALYSWCVVGTPVLFRQARVGQDGKIFTLVKFRTMTKDAEARTGPIQAVKNDPRIVRGMGWIRQTRLDELPQLWNVLRGQMSVVGPRPERPEMTVEFERLIPGYQRRHEVPPGITGLAQVHGRYHTDPEYKLGHDLQYLANWSPILDLQIMVRTAWVVLSRQG